jgi:2-keto-4-pentenoate hydratase/2-oxohepta-3-ene-1,7-dioic acid hydratase in catechol pathway
MRLLTFDKGGRPTSGVRKDDAVVDLSIAAPELPGDWPAIFAVHALERVAEAVAGAGPKALVPAGDVHLMVPIPRPPKILCIGLNYRSHAIETGMAIPDYPIVFTRYPTSLTAHETPLLRPAASDNFDFEAELVAVIGTAGRHIPKARALDHVAGYSICNEGSVRDFQFKSSQWLMGKNFDRSGSFGPEIVTADELPPGAAGLRIQCRLNGETLQDSDIDDLIFDVATLVSALSEVMTLEPGDIIITGTPPGVGFVRKPPLFLKAGDVCEIEIEGIGILRNSVVDEGST